MNIEKWREFIKYDLEKIIFDLEEFSESVHGHAKESQSYFKEFNFALYVIKRRVLWGNVATCFLLGLIL